jgi:hypothetical protein
LNLMDAEFMDQRLDIVELASVESVWNCIQ